MAAALALAVALENQGVQTIEEVTVVAGLECRKEGRGKILGRRRVKGRRR